MLALDSKIDHSLNDYNIAQLQLQYSSKEEIDLPRNTQDFKFPPSADPINSLYVSPLPLPSTAPLPNHLSLPDSHPMLDSDIDYSDRRMSTSAASGISTATTDTAASTSRVAGEKRAPSPDASPRTKRQRPTLDLNARHYGQIDSTAGHAGHALGSLSPRTGDDQPSIRTPEPPSSASASMPNTAASDSGKVHLPPIYASPYDSPSSAHSMHHLQPPSHHHMSIGGSPGTGAYGTVGGLAPRKFEHELRRGSLPNLYSESLSIQRNTPMGTRVSSGLSQSYSTSGIGVPSGRSNFTFSQPYSTSSSTDGSSGGGLSSYQFPAPGSPAHAKTAGEEYYSASSAASSGFPHTPLDSGNAGDYSTAPSSAPASAIARPNSTPGQLPADSPGGLFGSSAPTPRLSGHHGSERKSENWYSQGGMLSLPSASSPPGSTGAGSTTLPTLPTLPSPPQQSQEQQQSPQSQQQQAANRPPQRRRGKLPKPTTDFLKDWLHRHSDHPYPSEEEKKQLCNATGLSMSQVSNWMINARRRILAPANRAAQGPTTTVPFPSSRSGPGGPLNNLGLGGIGGGVGGMGGSTGGLHNIGGGMGGGSGGGGLALSHLPAGYHQQSSTSSASSGSLYDVGMGMGGGMGGMGGRRASMPAALSMGGMGVNDMHSHHPYSQSSGNHNHNHLQLYHHSGGASSGSGSHMHSLHSSQSSDYLRGSQSQLGLSRHAGGYSSNDIYQHRGSLPYSHSLHPPSQQHHQTLNSNPSFMLSPATYSSSPGGNGNGGRLPALASVSATRGYTFPDNGASEVGSSGDVSQ